MKNELENFIQHNREKFDRKTPDSAGVFGRVLQQMQPEAKPSAKGILVPLRVIQWAAAAVILLAVGIAFWALRKQPEKTTIAGAPVIKILPGKKSQADSVKQPSTEMAQTETEKHKGIDEVDHDLALRRQALLAKLKTQSAHAEKQVLFASLNNMESPASRITAIDNTYKLKDAGDDVVNALVETLNSDPNTNVRLAALDGLSRFYQDNYVRKKLIASLKKQQDPFVQIALINLLTRMKESTILSQLNQMVKDENTDESVKGSAYSGILQLQSS